MENKLYIFNNWSSEDFIGRWDSKDEIIKAGELKELPFYLAEHYAKHFVDREMNRDGKSTVMGNANAREPYMDKTISPIGAGSDSLVFASLKEEMEAKIRAEVEAEIKNTKTPKKVEIVKESKKEESKEEFAGLK